MEWGGHRELKTTLGELTSGGAPQGKAPLSAPGAVRHAFVSMVNRGDLDGATACFADNGRIVIPGTAATHACDSPAALLSQLISRNTEIEVTQSDSLEVDGLLALASERWEIRSGEPAAYPQDLTATLMFNNFEGSWKLSLVVLVAG